MARSLILPRRGLTRRAALGTLGASAVAAGFPGLVRAQSESTPARGGHLKFGISRGSSSNTLDPTTYVDYETYCASCALGNFLVELDSDKIPRPELAESWESSDGAKKWIFKLRRGVEFHNGKTFTVDDAIYSLNLHRGEATTSPAKPFLETWTDIRKDGEDTLVIELSEGNADIPAILALYQLVIVPDGFDDWANFVGTGAYALESFEPGVRLFATRNPNYWKDDRGWVDSYEQISIIDPTARLNALLTGEVNMIDRVEAKTIGRLRSVDSLYLVENPGVSYQSIAMNTDYDTYKDNNVRLALKYGIDREEILQKVSNGLGVVGNDHPVPPNDPYFNADLEQRTYDPDKAKHHLKQAGLDSVSVDLSAADAAFPGAVDAAQLFAETGAKAGVLVNVVREPGDGYWSNVWLKKPACMVNWNVRATPPIHFSLAFACGAPWNDSHLCIDRFEELLTRSKVETDFEKRKQIIGEMQQIQKDEGGALVMMFQSSVDAYANDVRGAHEDAAGMIMGARVAERVWVES